MQRTCSTCKWWKREPEGSYSDHRYGLCESVKFDYSDRARTDDMVLYWDAEGYCASLLTGQNFGCVHWEAE